MKNFIVLAICLCMILSGCGSAAEAPTQETLLENNDQVATESTAETDPIVETTKETEPPKKSVTIDDIVVYEDEKFKLTAKNIDFEDKYDVKVKFLAENNSDSTVAFLGNDFTVNGITMYGSFYIKLSPGKKANDFLEIRKDDLISRGVSEISTIQGQDCYIYDDDNSKKITDFQFKIETSIAGEYQQEIDRSGQTVFEKDGITIKYRGIVPGRFDEEEMEFFVENTSENNISVYVDDVSVNGFMVYGNMVANAYPNCVTYETVDFSSSDLEENDIETIEEVCITFYGYDQNAKKKVWTTDEIILGRTATTQANDPIDAFVDEIKQSLAYENLSITNSENVIAVSYWMDGLSNAVSMAASGDADKATLWDTFVENEIKQCNLVVEAIKEKGFDNYSVSWTIMDDLDETKSLLTVIDGTVTYNAAE